MPLYRWPRKTMEALEKIQTDNETKGKESKSCHVSDNAEGDVQAVRVDALSGLAEVLPGTFTHEKIFL
eukprot:IDg4797t1